MMVKSLWVDERLDNSSSESSIGRNDADSTDVQESGIKFASENNYLHNVLTNR